MSSHSSPVMPKERHVILDVLRGVALFGICLANYPEFSLYTFLGDSVTSAMPTASVDTVVKYLQYIFIDGKFYTIFSLLFGIGFTIILANAGRKTQHPMRLFYRRMGILMLFGLFHLLFLWAGDILVLYAFAGFFLPLFRNLPDKKLLIWSVIFLLFPILIETGTGLFGWELAAPVNRVTAYFHRMFGITEEGFPVWLVESKTYLDVLKFNLAGSFIRMQEFIDGHRLFKVLGLFLLGLYIGRKKLYADLETKKEVLKKGLVYSFMIGFPTTLLYAWSAMNSYPLGLVSHSMLYAVSVVPFGFFYIFAICLLYIQHKERRVFKVLAAPGRMALTNYIFQSVIGMIIFYGIGFGLGAKTGLIYVEIIAAMVFGFQILYSYVWLYYNQFGPLEWIWRMLTYKKRLKLS